MKQLGELEALSQAYQQEGLEVLVFPCNQFGKQEPGELADLQAFYDHQLTVFERLDVNGKNAHPLYRFLKKKQKGFLRPAIKWNFSKFLVDRQGQVVRRFPPTTAMREIEEAIKALL